MKKCISIFLSLLLIMSLGFHATAHEASTGDIVMTVINELDILDELSQMSEPELIEIGYTSEEIADIYNYEDLYVEQLYSYSDLPEENLIRLGYSDEQIDLLRDFSGTSAEVQALAASLNFSLSCLSNVYDSSTGRSNASLLCSWSWNGTPLNKTTDIVAISYNDWFRQSENTSVTYLTTTGHPGTITRTATYVPNNGPTSYGSGYKIAMTQENNYWWAQNGSISLRVYHSGRHDMSAYAAYGHSYLAITPSFSVPGWLSINFGTGTSKDGEDWSNKSWS